MGWGVVKIQTGAVCSHGARARIVHTQVTCVCLRSSGHRDALGYPWIDPADVSTMLVFLASGDARYVTGVEIPIDAGFGLL